MEKFLIITYLEFFLKIESKNIKAFQNEALKKDHSRLTFRSKF